MGRIGSVEEFDANAMTQLFKADSSIPSEVNGLVKWFDAAKGFGFVVADEGGPDILLHANVLRNFGQGSVADGSRIALKVQETPRGLQAVEVVDVTPPDGQDASPNPIAAMLESLTDVPLTAARVKWFDKAKGFGFANAYGQRDDIFLHIEVLRKCGLADLETGEAVCLRIVEGDRGQMAAEVHSWDYALDHE